MKNLLYFARNFGNENFNDRPFDEVDALLLCQLAYLNFEKIVKEDKEIYLYSIIKNENFQILCDNTVCENKNLKLLKLLSHCNRYRYVKINYIRNQLCYENIEQFFAITFIFNDFIFVAFRGTDVTILGWKENFNMSYLKEIPSQRDSVIYINKIYDIYKKKMYIGGHSKGGNLALYSAMYSKNLINNNIIKVFNFDGPGFSNNIFGNEEYLQIENKLVTLTTQEAIIAVLMYHTDSFNFVNAKGFSIFKHDAFNWTLTKDGRFKYIKRNTPQSRWFDRAIRHFYEDTTDLDRKKFVDILFTIIEVSPNTTVFDFKRHPIRFIKGVRVRFKLLTKDEKKFFKSILKKLRRSFYHILKLKIKRKI